VAIAATAYSTGGAGACGGAAPAIVETSFPESNSLCGPDQLCPPGTGGISSAKPRRAGSDSASAGNPEPSPAARCASRIAGHAVLSVARPATGAAVLPAAMTATPNSAPTRL